MEHLKISLILFVFVSCTKDKGIVDNGSNYPKEIAGIVLTKCAVSGCHNTLSKDAAAGLSLVSWDALFEGGRNGSVVVPFRPDFSTLCFYTNSFSELGPALSPRMPVGLDPLTKDEVLILKNWIREGAPNATGAIKFKENSLRSKLYVTNQLCDLVMVLDAESKLIMRCIDVGSFSKTEFPICVKTSADKKNCYVSFLASHFLQKYDAVTDLYSGQVDLGDGVWSTFEITSDSRYAFCADNSLNGKIAQVDLQEMKVIRYYQNVHFIYPRSIAVDNKLKKLYLGAENGNYISVIDYGDLALPLIKQLIVDGSPDLISQSVNDPISLIVDESSHFCFVACRNSKEIKVVNTLRDSIVASIYLNAAPTFMDNAAATHKLLITCTDDSLSFPGNLGSVKVVDVISKQVLKTINPGYQPNGIAVNNDLGYAAVINSNISPKGSSPHHVSGCGGRNGNISFIDLNTFEMVPNKKFELAVYPYSVALRK